MRVAWCLIAGLVAAGCSGVPVRHEVARLVGDPMVWQVINDAPGAKSLEDRVWAPDGERLLLAVNGRLERRDLEAVMVRPGWMPREQSQGVLGVRRFAPGRFTEVHLIFRESSAARIQALAQDPVERLALMEGDHVRSVWPVVAIRDREIILASDDPQPGSVWSRLHDDGVRAQLDQTDLYVQWLRRRWQASPDAHEPLQAFAREILEGPAKDCALAESLIQPLLPRATKDEVAANVLGGVVQCYARREATRDMLRVAEQILAARPDVGNALGLRPQIAEAYRGQGDIDRAVQELTAYVEYLKMSTRADKDERIRQAVATIELLRQTASASQSSSTKQTGQEL